MLPRHFAYAYSSSNFNGRQLKLAGNKLEEMFQMNLCAPEKKLTVIFSLPMDTSGESAEPFQVSDENRPVLSECKAHMCVLFANRFGYTY